jgi:acetoin utilization deacetylase AcuC-like enzyme
MSSPRIPLFYVDDARFDAHVPPREHPERPERMAAVRRGLVAALIDHGAIALPARLAETSELLRAHSPAHLAHLEELYAAAPCTIDDGDTYVSPHTREAALLCAGSAAMLGRFVMERTAVRAVLTGRPPGHHATRNQAMGFCLLNNVAVAAYAALAAGADRVAIVDFDVHHGNGTQDIFEDDPRVLFVSVHESPLYPDSGYVHEIGRDAGKGFTINVPLPPGSGGADYAAAFRDVVEPALGAFDADVTFVSAGFDAHARDPLATMRLEASDYGAMACSLIRAATRRDTARLCVLLEGGYDLVGLEVASQAVGRALAGADYAFGGGAASADTAEVLASVIDAHHGFADLKKR